MKKFLLPLIVLLSATILSKAGEPLPLPTVITTAAIYVDCSNAELSGIINANGSSTTVSFEYGLTASYGNTLNYVNPNPVNGTSNVNVHGLISGLNAATLYHFRCVGVNASGTAYGADMTFTTLDSVPNTYTGNATNIATTSARLNGSVSSSGQTAAVSFEWGPTAAYGNTITAIPSSVNGYSTVLANLTGLTSATIYHYRCTATNSTGTSNGNDVTFTTTAPPAPPAVTTTAATNITSFNVNINGTVNANNVSSTVSFEFGTTTAYGTTISGYPSVVTGTTTTACVAFEDNLIPGTTYHFRIKATNSAGTSYGSDMTFTTPFHIPLVDTYGASFITNTTAQLNGFVNPCNQSATVTFQWGLTSAYGNTVSATPGTVPGNTDTAVSTIISGLTPNTLYHFRCVAVNSTGTGYGWDTTFTTTPVVTPPTINTTTPDQIVANYARLNGNGNSNGSSTTVTFEYGTSPGYGNVVSAIPPTITGTSIVNVSSYIYGLTAHTIYHYRCVGVNAGGTTYGADITFITGDTVPDVTTNPATFVTSASAQLNGLVNANNLSSSVSFEWGTTSSYGNTVTASPSGATGNTYVPVLAGITGLTLNTAYHYRCVATNSAGTNYGADMTFFTGCTPPGSAGPVAGPDTVCIGTDSILYFCDSVPGALYYNWSVPSGAIIVSGAGTTSILIIFTETATSGIVSVYAGDSCGNGPVSSLNVAVLPLPEAPVIILNGYNLISSFVSGNQWYRNGELIPGAVTQEWDASVSGSGWYWDVYTVAGFQSDTSNNVYVLIESVNEIPEPVITISPVPNNGQFRLFISNPVSSGYTFEIYDNTGKKVYSFEIVSNQTTGTIDLRPVSDGIYYAVLKNTDHRVIKRFVITK